MRARLHSRLLLLASLPPCYCGSAEHPTMPALQLALGHTLVLVVPAARARSLPQPSQLRPMMHPGLLSLRAPAPVLARRPRARGLWLSLAAQPRHTVRLRRAAYSAPEAPISAQPTPLARRPPPTPVGSSSRTGSRACRVVLTRRPLRPPARPRVSVTPPSTTPGVAPGHPASTPVGLHVQRPAAPSVRRLRLLRRAASSHRLGRARLPHVEPGRVRLPGAAPRPAGSGERRLRRRPGRLPRAPTLAPPRMRVAPPATCAPAPRAQPLAPTGLAHSRASARRVPSPPAMPESGPGSVRLAASGPPMSTGLPRLAGSAHAGFPGD
nr:atherin-like [Aegilops tauschii subsp. strangulata]